MGINPNQISLTDITGSAAVEGSVILSKNNGENTWSSNSTESLKLPSGTTAQRNTTGINGQFRFNSQTQNLELYTDASSAWKSAGQLNIAGAINDPGIAFNRLNAGEIPPGFYHPAANQIGLGLGGAQKVLWAPDMQTVYSDMTVNGTITANAINITGASSLFSTKPVQTLPLYANKPSPFPIGGSLLTYAASQFCGIKVDYMIKRDANFGIGTFLIVNNTTTARLINRAYGSTLGDTNALGIVFGVSVNGTNVEVNYTSTAGSDLVGRFSVSQWSAF